MIVYEVNVFGQRGIEREYRVWLDAHVRQMLHLPGFVTAAVFECVEPEGQADDFGLCVHYRLNDESALANYMSEHAPRLRAEGTARFGSAFRAQRRILRTLADY